MLDDSVMFAKRLRSIDQPVTLCVVDDLPHGFLSLSQVCRETKEAADVCVERIRAVFSQEDAAAAPEPRKHRKLERTDGGASASPPLADPAEEGKPAVGNSDGEGVAAWAAPNNTDAVGVAP